MVPLSPKIKRDINSLLHFECRIVQNSHRSSDHANWTNNEYVFKLLSSMHHSDESQYSFHHFTQDWKQNWLRYYRYEGQHAAKAICHVPSKLATLKLWSYGILFQHFWFILTIWHYTNLALLLLLLLWIRLLLLLLFCNCPQWAFYLWTWYKWKGMLP